MRLTAKTAQTHFSNLYSNLNTFTIIKTIVYILFSVQKYKKFLYDCVVFKNKMNIFAKYLHIYSNKYEKQRRTTRSN